MGAQRLAEPFPLYLALSVPAGFGLGLAFSYSQIVTQTVVPSGQSGAAAGAVLTVLVGLGGVGIALAASLLDTAATIDGAYTRGDLDPIFVGAGVLVALTIPLVAGLARARGGAGRTAESS